MEKVIQCLVVFYSHSQGMLLYRMLLTQGCSVEFVSTPCRLTDSCSQSLKFNEYDLRKVKEKIAESNIKIKGIYKIVIKNSKIQYIEMI